MTEVASRLYSSAAAAEDAANALRRAGYRAHELTILSKPDGSGAAARDALVAAAKAAGVFKARAGVLADGVLKGATAVVCRARFTNGAMVSDMLDARGPIDPGTPSGSVTASDTEAAPLSDILGLRVLGGRGDFFSRLFGLPTLSRSKRASAKLMGQTGPYKPIIPMPLLSGTAGGYRPSIPMPLLAAGRGGYKPMIPMPTLSGSDRGSYRPVIPVPTLTSASD